MSDAFLRSLFSLEGRRAVVTGGSSGIGLAVAEGLARAGAEVMLVARDEGRLKAVAHDLTADGLAASYAVADVGEPDVADRIPGLADVDVLVNCAGINRRPVLPDTTDEDYALTMAVNLRAPYLLGQVAGPAMAARGWGRIINVGSQQTWSAFGNSGVYGVSKAAVAGLSRSQAEAWSSYRVTSNTLVPGFVVTPMTEQTIAQPGREAALAARTMAGRNGVPGDFVGAAVFLASDASAYVTGQTLAVDGGFSVH